MGLAVQRRVLHDPDEAASGRASTIWLLGLVRLVRRIKLPALLGEAPYTERRGPRYMFVEPVVQTESRARTVGERNRLKAAEGRLWRWYMRRILGQKISEAGRPVGTTETFTDCEQFRTIMSRAIHALQQQGLHPAQERVAGYLGQHPDGVGFRSEAASIDDRQLRRWRERCGYKDWRALLHDLSH